VWASHTRVPTRTSLVVHGKLHLKCVHMCKFESTKVTQRTPLLSSLTPRGQPSSASRGVGLTLNCSKRRLPRGLSHNGCAAPAQPFLRGEVSTPTGGVLCNAYSKERIFWNTSTSTRPSPSRPELPGPQTRGWPVRAGTRLRESSHEDQLSVRRHRHTRRRSCLPTARPCTG
jgi:hypothetical protein